MTTEAAGRIAAFLARPEVAGVLAALNAGGVETRIVGGAVRDLLLGEPPGDLDLATTAPPPETIRLGEAAGYRAVPTGIAHGTVTLVRDGASFEVTSLRRDVETDGRHAVVAFGTDFAEDARRRDFTVNALGLGRDGVVHDDCGGIADLSARRIRFIGDANRRIAEDYLRILRFFRFHARLGHGPLDRESYAACIAGRSGLAGLSRERVRAEMLKLVVAPGAADAVEAMAGAGLLLPVLGCVPHVARFRAISGDSGEGVYPAFRLAALAVSISEDAARLKERLRLSNEEFDRISRLALALEALSGRVGEPAIAALRHLAHRLGVDAVTGALILQAAGRNAARQTGTQALIDELGRTPAFQPGGRDVLALGVPAGPSVGQALERARYDWIEAGCPPGKADQMAFVAAAVATLMAT